MSTSDVALAAMAAALTQQMRPTEEDRRIQAGIDATMRGVIAEQVDPDPTRVKNPTTQRIPEHLLTNQPKPPQGTGLDQALLVIPPKRGTGWVDAAPLSSPPGQETIERIANALAPHGPEHGKKAEGEGG